MKHPNDENTHEGLDRRTFLTQVVGASAALVGFAGCAKSDVSADGPATQPPRQQARAQAVVPAAPQPLPVEKPAASPPEKIQDIMPIERVQRLSFPWETRDPFLFCVHHLDDFPQGNEHMGPAAPLAGRRLGQDFSNRDGWSMYHGRQIPGFPRHPHRGFETVTVIRRGNVDHSDSLGATARFGAGDAQWMTAGKGIEHAEMFPLRERHKKNSMEFFQIWLNLPKRSKMVAPYFTMLWSERIPRRKVVDAAGKTTVVTIVAGALQGDAPPSPPPDSWASDARSDVAIWTIDIEAGGSFTLPAASAGLARSLYFFRGGSLGVAGQQVAETHRVDLRSDTPVVLQAGEKPAELLLLQGRPIGEPVARHGPFVMNTRQELQQAFADYRSGQFGRWPWSGDAPVHSREQGRFAVHADGRRDTPT